MKSFPEPSQCDRAMWGCRDDLYQEIVCALGDHPRMKAYGRLEHPITRALTDVGVPVRVEIWNVG